MAEQAVIAAQTIMHLYKGSPHGQEPLLRGAFTCPRSGNLPSFQLSNDCLMLIFAQSAHPKPHTFAANKGLTAFLISGMKFALSTVSLTKGRTMKDNPTFTAMQSFHNHVTRDCKTCPAFQEGRYDCCLECEYAVGLNKAAILFKMTEDIRRLKILRSRIASCGRQIASIASSTHATDCLEPTGASKFYFLAATAILTHFG